MKKAVAPMLAFSALMAAAPAPGDHDRTTLIANERAWGQAFITGDVATVNRLLARDFQGFETDGSTYSKADTISFVKAVPHGTADRVDNFKSEFLVTSQSCKHTSG